MLVVQYNYRKAYAITIAALETSFALNATIICLQEPYIEPKNYISHSEYILYWLEEGDLKDKRVAIVIRRDLTAKIIIEAQIDLINHLYVLIFDIWNTHYKSRIKMRRTRLVNTYDNRIGLRTCYKGNYDRSKRAIEDIRWESVLRSRVVLLGDFNAHSPAWDPLIFSRTEAGSLKQIIEDYSLILNNELGAITKPGKTRGSIIDLMFTTLDIGPLESWAVERDNPTLSDHELIVLNS
jgi:hypothetical protein